MKRITKILNDLFFIDLLSDMCKNFFSQISLTFPGKYKKFSNFLEKKGKKYLLLRMFGVIYLLFLLFGFRKSFMMSNIHSPIVSVKAVESGSELNAKNNVEESSLSRSESKEDEVPLLPPPRESGTEYKEFKLGEAMKMDELGPMIITPEGNIRRIANWANLTKAEQAVAWRRISARNKERVEAIKASEAKETKGDQAQDSTETEIDQDENDQ